MKPETEIRNLKRELANARRDYYLIHDERNLFRRDRDEFRERLTKANLELAEWKRRFDLLLAKCELATGKENP